MSISKTFDHEKIASDFPILSRRINENQLVYLDNAATTQKPLMVLDTLKEFYSRHNANVHRGVYLLSEEDCEKQRLLKVKEFIDNIDLNTTTPLEALNILHRLKNDN